MTFADTLIAPVTRATLWRRRDLLGLNQLLYLVCVGLITFTLMRYSTGIWMTFGYRFGVLELAALPQEMQIWLPAVPLWQDVIYMGGYVGAVMTAGLLLARRREALWVYIFGGALARLDWALLPAQQDSWAQFLGYSAFAQYLVVTGFLMVLVNRRVLN
ncbi:hypothetical protein [Maricaulis sp. CAU 1757]